MLEGPGGDAGAFGFKCVAPAPPAAVPMPAGVPPPGTAGVSAIPRRTVTS